MTYPEERTLAKSMRQKIEGNRCFKETSSLCTRRISVRLNRTRNSAIISHLYERALSMNNSIAQLFRWRISLRMYCVLFFSFATRVKAGTLLLVRDLLSTTHFTFRSCLEWCFARVIFITLLYTHYRCVRCIVTPLAESIAVHYHNCAFIVIALLQSVSVSINKK